MNVARLMVVVALLTITGSVIADDLRDFTTDGCSLFPDGSPVEPTLWCDCCVAHDLAYWRGGTKAERMQADEELRACVEKRTQSKAFAQLVYSGVRAGGHPIFPTWYRWGYGWKYGRSYAPLTAEEIALTEQKLASYRANHPNVTCVDSDAVTPLETPKIQPTVDPEH